MFTSGKNIYEKGQSIVEILIAIGMVAVILGSVVATYVVSLRANANARLSAVGVQLAGETYDNIRALAEADWHTITAVPRATNHHLTLAGGNFNVNSGVETIIVNDIQYTRSFIIENVHRDTGGNIVTPSGIEHPSTQRVVVTVSWPIVGATGETSMAGFIARNRNVSLRATNWTDGPLQTEPFTPFVGETSVFASSENIDFTTLPGVIRILNF